MYQSNLMLKVERDNPSKTEQNELSLNFRECDLLLRVGACLWARWSKIYEEGKILDLET